MSTTNPKPSHASRPRARRSQAERSASTQGQLLQAAMGVVRERSYSAASLFEVAKRAGVTPGAVQHHFGSRAELMMRLVDRLLRSDDEDAVPWPQASLPLVTRANALLEVMWTHLYEPPRFLVAWQIYFGSVGDEAMQAHIAQLRRQTQGVVRERFWQVLPELRADADAAALIDLVLSALRGMAMVRLFEPQDEACRRQRAELARMLLARCEAAAAASPDSRASPVSRTAPTRRK